jgi:hypothetical protein
MTAKKLHRSRGGENMRLARIFLVAAGLAATMSAGPFCTPSPGTFCSSGAGFQPSDAANTEGTGALSLIIGQLFGSANLFAIEIPNTSAFSANYTGYSAAGVDATPGAALYLFDSHGDGIEAADDGSIALGGFTGTGGLYYIGIAPDGNDPEYLQASNPFLIFNPFVSGAVSFPVGGAGPIAAIGGPGCTPGAGCDGGYEISLNGTNFANLPEPASLFLTGLALIGLGVLSASRRLRFRA